MKRLISAGAFALALFSGAALAQQPAACERVEFSEQVLARFPNIRNACLDVINRDGQSFAVVRANLVRVTPRRMTVRVQLPDGTQSDTMGINVASKPVHVHDFQATVLHLLGLDHERLTYRFQGRDFRLTDVHGHVVKDLLA